MRLAFTFDAASGLLAAELVAAVAWIGNEQTFAVETRYKSRRRRHSGDKETDHSVIVRVKNRDPFRFTKKIREENGGRRKKRFS